MKLTKTFIDELSYQGTGKAAQYHWDDRIPGFGIRVLPSGTKVFVFFYRYAGKQRWASLGRYGAITLHQALKLAQDRYIELKGGKDPKTEMERQKYASTTMAEFADYYYENHAKVKNRGHIKVKNRIDKWVKPKLGKLLVREVQTHHLAKLHTQIGKTHPVNANRVLALISKMFTEARRWGFVDRGAPNPAQDVEKFPEAPRERNVTMEEFPRLAKAINKRDPFVKAMVWLYLMTGFRKSELLRLKWDDATPEKLVARLTKKGNHHAVPLAAVGWALIKDLPRFKGNHYVFPGAKEGEHRKDLRRQWENVLEEAEITDLRIHDLRHFVGTKLAEMGFNANVIKDLLNHSSLAMTQRYINMSGKPLQEAVEAQAKFLEPYIMDTIEAEATDA